MVKKDLKGAGVVRSMEDTHGQRNASSAGKRAILPVAGPLVQDGGSRETERPQDCGPSARGRKRGPKFG